MLDCMQFVEALLENSDISNCTTIVLQAGMRTSKSGWSGIVQDHLSIVLRRRDGEGLYSI